MADEVLSDEAAMVLVDGDPLVVELKSDSGADAKPAYLVEQTSETECGLNPAGGTKAMGIAKEDRQLDADSAFAAGKTVVIYQLGCGSKVRGFLDSTSSQTVYSGQIAVAGATTAGTFDLCVAAPADIRTLVGRIGRYDASVAGEVRLCYLVLGV